MVRVTVWKTENTGTVHVTLPEEMGKGTLHCGFGLEFLRLG